MASKQSRRSIDGSAKKTDDLMQIRGIGPSLTDRLHEAGILTFSQLASISPEKLAARINGLTAKHISAQNWIGQARKLAQMKYPPKTPKRQDEPPTPRQHYANFTIEFLFDDKKEVRRTRVTHIQSGVEATWAGWQTVRLNDFLVRQTHIHSPNRKLLPKTNESAGSEASQNARVEPSSQFVEAHKPVSPSSDNLSVNRDPPVNEVLGQNLPSRVIPDSTGSLCLSQLEVVTSDSDVPIFALRQGQPYLLRLTLDLQAAFSTKDSPQAYETLIIFKQFNGQDYFMNVAGSIRLSSDKLTISLAGISLPQGMYRLHASVRLPPDKTSPEMTAFLKGDLLQVC